MLRRFEKKVRTDSVSERVAFKREGRGGGGEGGGRIEGAWSMEMGLAAK